MGTAIAAGDEAERLNRGCFCITLDRYALMEALNREVGVGSQCPSGEFLNHVNQL
jgi:hypothetical protein